MTLIEFFKWWNTISLHINRLTDRLAELTVLKQLTSLSARYSLYILHNKSLYRFKLLRMSKVCPNFPESNRPADKKKTWGQTEHSTNKCSHKSLNVRAQKWLLKSSLNFLSVKTLAKVYIHLLSGKSSIRDLLMPPSDFTLFLKDH